MKKIGIMTDSHSGILTEEAEKLGIKVLPMPFYIDDELYLEGVDLSREEFYEKLRQGVNVSTSMKISHCPRKNFIKNWQRMQRYLPHSHLHRK